MYFRFRHLILPAGTHILAGIETGHIGFNIQERGAIKNVHLFNRENIVLNATQFDYAKPYRIRTMGARIAKMPCSAS
jgi:hypothetical protein